VTNKRIYLRLHDKVAHHSHEEWGDGVVVEEMTSSVPGGTCLVRIMFDDGRQRTFNNDMENELCCYFFGVRKLWQMDLDTPGDSARPPHRMRQRIPRR
jgi:hypothetical protein